MSIVSAETEMDLLGHVQRRVYLYDRKHLNYKNKTLRINTWKIIGDLMGMTSKHFNKWLFYQPLVTTAALQKVHLARLFCKY